MSREDNIKVQSSNLFYLLYHAILKEPSTTTKLRVVLNGKCKSGSGVSLNDKFEVGSTLQDNLCWILIRFREHNFVMTGDIEKMYCQIVIASEERNLQRTVWRERVDQPIQYYSLNVTYGTASASFIAVRNLQQAMMLILVLLESFCSTSILMI